MSQQAGFSFSGHANNPPLKHFSNAVTTETGATWQRLENSQWREWLCLYPPDEIYFGSISYSNGCLQAVITPHTPAYTLAHPTYYTASQLVLITSQMCYMLAGAALLDVGFPSLPRGLYETFMTRLRETAIYYTKMEIGFRRKILNNQEFTAGAKIERARKMQNILIMKATLNCDQDAARVGSTLVMPVTRATEG